MTLSDQKKNIFFVIIALIFISKICLLTPFIDSWRQADTAAVARNFFESGNDIFHPQVDWRGDGPGYAEMEFPAYSYTVALFYGIFGVNELYGKLLSIFFSLLTLYYIYRVVTRNIDESTAIWSVLFYAALPYNYYHSKLFMPEPLMIMSSAAGIHYFSEWAWGFSKKNFYLSAFFISLACLLKLPSLYLGLPLLFLCHLKYRKNFLFEKDLWFYAFLVLLPVVAWYYHAHALFLKTGLSYGIWEYGGGKWGSWSFSFSFKFWSWMTLKISVSLLYSGLLIFIWGIFTKRVYHAEALFDFWILSILIYFIIVSRGNFTHAYYQMPFMLPAAVFIGKTYSRQLDLSHGEKFKVNVLLLFSLLWMLLSAPYYNILTPAEIEDIARTSELASLIEKKSSPEDLVLFVEVVDPMIFYHSKRKGWRVTAAELENLQTRSEFIKKGARYIAGFYNYANENEMAKKIKTIISAQPEKMVDNEKYFLVRIGGK